MLFTEILIFILIFFLILKIEAKVSCIPGKYFTTELHIQP
jgi:hypothetical protein